MGAFLQILGYLLSAATISFAAIYNSVDSLPAIPYDFVIIGGGTAGNVVANRLTENPKLNVLVIESGPSNVEGTAALNSIVPFFSTVLGGSAFDWNFTTTPQSGLNGRILPYARGHVLGGSSSTNGMFYTRGSSSDFDRIAAVTGDQGWSWSKLQPYVRKTEKWSAPADNHNTAGQFDPLVHGFNGINSVSLNGFPQNTDSRVIRTTVDLKDEFPFNLDMNSGNPLGLGWLQSTIGKGQRSSSATSYLGPTFIKRPNLHVLLNSRVTRVLQSKSSGQTPTFLTVELTSDRSPGALTQITARKEIILAAGTIGTPQILLNSGIGDKTKLKAVGINPIVDLPSVGENLTDHPAITTSWFVNSTDTLDNITNNATFRTALLNQWEKSKTGPLVNAGASHLAWLRLPKNSPIFEKSADPASGANSPHYELVIAASGLGLTGPVPGNFITIGTVVVSPVARGSVSVKSSNPLDAPLIDPGFLDSEFDIFAMRYALQSARRFLGGPAWKDYILSPAGSFVNATTDALLDAYARESTFSTAHPVGTAAMSPKGAKYGVVDPDLRVKGVSGLRIVDASVLPYVPGAHSQAAVYIIAERGADLIKGGLL